MENNTLNSTVCKIAEERQRMIAYITDPDVNNFIGISRDAVEGLKRYIPYMSYSVLTHLEEDLYEVFQEVNYEAGE